MSHFCCDSREPSGEVHTLTELTIDYASEPGTIEFRSCHKENVIHCYMLGMLRNGTILSYIPLLQLTVSEIIDRIQDDIYFNVKVVVIFSKMSTECLDNFDNVLVECLQKNGPIIDKPVILPSEPAEVKNTPKSIALNGHSSRDDMIRDDLRKCSGRHRKRLLKKQIDHNLIQGYPLYTKLEFISLNISRSNASARLTDILIPLISPYFENPMVAKPLLEDLRALVLSKKALRSMRKQLEEKVVVSDMPEHTY